MRFKHARERALERYGLRLDAKDLTATLAAIRGGRAIFAHRNPDGSEHHDVAIFGIICRVVIDPTKRQIVTFLPPGASPEKPR